MKKIFVPIKRVLDWQLKVKPNAEGTDVDKSNAKWIINTFDEIAVEEALRIRDSGVGFSEVVLACIGPVPASEQIRSALAMGADRAVHVICDDNLDSEQVAYILSSLIKRDSYDLVLQNDVNTRGHNQWFYFKITNTKKNQKIKLNIVNLVKK